MLAVLPAVPSILRRSALGAPLARAGCPAGVARVALAALALVVAAPAGPVHAQAVADADALLGHLQWRNIGPANMAGRVTDIEAVEADFSRVIVAAASGGLWRSDNAGTTWEPVFEEYGTANMGDVAIHQADPDIVWVGTGESCTRNSVAWGDGVYRSLDGGDTFEHMGLEDTHHIGEVLIHPDDPDVVFVAAQGHLWGHTGQRGLFRTADGGRSWEKLTDGLPDDGRTGATDLVMHPDDPDVMWVSFWERIRRPHEFVSGGPAGGIFKTTDGGDTWTKLTDGLPEGDVGKIGLAVSRSNPEVVMAIVEHGYQPEARVEGRPNPEYEDMSRLGTGIYRSEDGGDTWTYVNRYNNRPFYYSHIYIDPRNDQRVYVLAGSAQVSEDGGRSFSRSFEGISGDFHALWIDPAQPDRFYVGNDKGSYVTYDRGHTFQMFDNMDIGQFYAVDADMRDPYWVYGGLQDNGNWGGPSNSRDWNGVLNDHWFKFHSGDGFHTTVDPDDWRTVYTEAQGGRLRRLDAVFRQVGESITPVPATILNFDEVWPGYDGPPDELPRERFRFNWSAPLRLSPHDSHTVLFGGNHVFRSRNRGETWEIISPDLTTNDPELTDPETGGLTSDITGAETHATLIDVAESPVRPGILWAGSDDGRVHVSTDDGRTWRSVEGNLPPEVRGLWVSRVEPSRFAEGRAYVSIDGHRSDEFRPWIFVTEDHGATWRRITDGIPADEPVYVVKEDPKNPDLLWAGTEFGAYVSVDRGRRWHRVNRGSLPTVAVHDLVIHPREGDVVAGTHGRSVWILDDVTALQQLEPAVASSELHLFRPRVATRWRGVSRGATRGHKLFQGRNPLSIEHRPPGNSPDELENSAALHVWLGEEPAGPVTVEVEPLSGEGRWTHTVEAPRAGINRVWWDLRFDPTEEDRRAFEERMERMVERFGPQASGFFGGRGVQGADAPAGTYRVRVTSGGRAVEGSLTVREDPGLGIAAGG